MLIKATIVLLGLLTAAVTVSYGQSVDSMANTVLNYPTRLLGKIQNKNADLDRQLTKQTERYLQKLADREARLKKKIARIDSTAASRLFSPSVQQQYAALEAGMRNDTSAATGNIHGQYLAGLDSMKVGLSFLQQNPQLLGTAGQAQLRQLQVSLAGLQQLQTKMANTSEVQDFIRQRKAAIRDCLSHLVHPPSGLAKEYQGFNQDLYYYDQQVEQYKQLLNDPDKLEKKALSMLDQFPAFQQFMRNNSQLASLFGVPGNSGTAQALAGLQTRDQLQQIVQGQISAGGSNALSSLQNNLQSAQSQLDELKDKLGKLGAGGTDMDDPNF